MRTSEDILKDIKACEERVNELFKRANTASFLDCASRLSETLQCHSLEIQSLKATGIRDDSLESLQKKIQELIVRLEPLTGVHSIYRDNRKILFQEAGQWARHFSTVRMTVITFTITSCTAILALASKTGGFVAPSDVADPVTVLWLLGLCVFWIFTVQTYRQMYHQKKGLSLFLTKVPAGELTDLPFDRASAIVAALCLTSMILAFLRGSMVSNPAKIALTLASAYGVIFLFCYRGWAVKSRGSRQ